MRLTMTRLAEAAGITVSMVSHIIAGRKDCPKRVAKVFERETGVPARDWLNAAAHPELRDIFGARGVRQTAEEKRAYNRERYYRLKGENHAW